MAIWHWLPILACLPATLTVSMSPKQLETDEQSHVLGSSVVTSVSVIMDHGNGTKTIFPEISSQIAARPNIIGSPGNMLEPDRYEFYTFDETGDLVKRLMTLEEIQGLIAGGDSEGIVGEASAPTYYHESMAMLPDEQTHLAANDFESSNMQGVHKVVESVQNVLKSELAATQSKPIYQKQPSDINPAPAWSILLPGLLDNSDESLPSSDINHLGDLSSMASENNFFQSTPNTPLDTIDNDDNYQKTRPTIIHYVPIENVPIKSSSKKPVKIPVSTTIKTVATKPSTEKYSFSTEKYDLSSSQTTKPSFLTHSTEKYIYPPSTTFGKYNYASSTSTEKPASESFLADKISYSSPSNSLNDKPSFSSSSNFFSDKPLTSNPSSIVNNKPLYSSPSNSLSEKVSYSSPVTDKNNYSSLNTEKNYFSSSSTEKNFYSSPTTQKNYFTNSIANKNNEIVSSTEKNTYTPYIPEKNTFSSHTEKPIFLSPTTEKKYYTNFNTEKNPYLSFSTEKTHFPSLNTEKHTHPTQPPEKYTSHLSTLKTDLSSPTTEKYSFTNSFSVRPMTNTPSTTSKSEYILNSEGQEALRDASSGPYSTVASTSSVTISHSPFSTTPYKTQSIALNEEMAASLSDVLSQMTDQTAGMPSQLSTILVPTTSKTTQQLFTNKQGGDKYSTKYTSFKTSALPPSSYSTTTSQPIFTKTTTYNKLSTFNNFTKIKPMYGSTHKVSTPSSSAQTQGFPNRLSSTYTSNLDITKKPLTSTNKFSTVSHEMLHSASTTSNKLVSQMYSADLRNNPTSITAASSTTLPVVTTQTSTSKKPTTTTGELLRTSEKAATTTTSTTTTTAVSTSAPKTTATTIFMPGTSPSKATVVVKKTNAPLTKIAVTTPAPTVSVTPRQPPRTTSYTPTASSTTISSAPTSASPTVSKVENQTEIPNTVNQKTTGIAYTKLPSLSSTTKNTEKPALKPIYNQINKTTSQPELDLQRVQIQNNTIKSTTKPSTTFQKPASTTSRPSLETAPPSKFPPSTQYTYKYPSKKPGSTSGSWHGPYYYPMTPLQLKHAAAQLAAAHNTTLKLNATNLPHERLPFPPSIFKQELSSLPPYTSTSLFRNSTNKNPKPAASSTTYTLTNTPSLYQSSATTHQTYPTIIQNPSLVNQNSPTTYSVRPSLQNYTSSTLMVSQKYASKLTTTTEAPHTLEITTPSQVVSNGHQNYITKAPLEATPPPVNQNFTSQNYQKIIIQNHTPTTTVSYKNSGLLKISSQTTPRYHPTQVKLTSNSQYSTKHSSTKTTQTLTNDTVKLSSHPRIPTTTSRFEEYIPVQTQQHSTLHRHSSTSPAPSTISNSKLMSDQSTEKSSQVTYSQIFAGSFNSVDDAIKKLSTLSLKNDLVSDEKSSNVSLFSSTAASVKTTPVSPTETTYLPQKNVSNEEETLSMENKEIRPTVNNTIDDHIQDGISAVTNILLQSKSPDPHPANSSALNKELVSALEEGAIIMPNIVLGEFKHANSIESQQIVSNDTDEAETGTPTEDAAGSTESSIQQSTTILDSLTTSGSKKETDSKENWLSDSVIDESQSSDLKNGSAAKSSDDITIDTELMTTTAEYTEDETEATKKEKIGPTTLVPETDEVSTEITTTVSPNSDDSLNKFRTENIDKDDAETTIKESDGTTASTTTLTTVAPVAPSTKTTSDGNIVTTSGVPAKENTEDVISEKIAPRPGTGKPTFTIPSIPKIPGPGAYRPITPPTAVELHPAPHESMGLEASIAFLGDDVRRFSDLCNELSFRMWTSITGKGMISSRSLVLSPFAVTSMLAMVFLGARGATSGQMNDVLRLDDMVTFNPHQVLQNITESVINSRIVGSSTAAFVRELYSDKSKGKILEFYKERAQQYYDGHVEEVNFASIGDVLRRRTNLLIKRQTLGRIPEYLRGSSLNLKPPMAAFAANIFQTDCDLASTEGRDGEMYFVVRPSTRQRRLVPVPAAVWRSGFLAGYEPGLDATAVSIGSDSIVSTIFVLPGQQGQVAPGDGLARLEQRLIETSYRRGGWSRLLRSLLLRPGLEIQLPRFSHRSVLNVTSALQRMGLKDIFDSDRADLRGLNGLSNDLYLSDMVQVNTFSTCGEDSAGARHHVETYPSSPQRVGREDPEMYPMLDDIESNIYSHLPLTLRPRQARLPDNPRLRFDRPFLYFVRHNPTGMILHIGRFNPRLLP